MAIITRYVLVNDKGTEDPLEYEDFEDAKADALGQLEQGRQAAIIERKYEYSDSELVWTPDGSSTWPPTRSKKTKTP